MKVFVTGATGFIGSHLVKELVAQGHDLRLLVRDQGKAERFFSSRGIPVSDYVVGDVTDREIISQALIDCNAVVHAAAATAMQSVSEETLFKTNVDGVKAVIGSACEQCIENIIYVSSVTAIFDPHVTELNGKSAIAKSRHPYGRSKAEAEAYIRQRQDEGKPIKTIYPAGVIGPDDPGQSPAVMALHYRVTQSFKITSGGTQQIDVRDLAKIMVGLLKSGDKKSGRYMTVGHYLTWDKFALLLESIIGRSLNKQRVAGWFLRAVGRYYDVKRLFMNVNSPISAETMSYATQWQKIDNDPIVKQMGITLTSPRQTFTDTLQWMLSSGKLRSEDFLGLTKSENSIL